MPVDRKWKLEGQRRIELMEPASEWTQADEIQWLRRVKELIEVFLTGRLGSRLNEVVSRRDLLDTGFYGYITGGEWIAKQQPNQADLADYDGKFIAPQFRQELADRSEQDSGGYFSDARSVAIADNTAWNPITSTQRIFSGVLPVLLVMEIKRLAPEKADATRYDMRLLRDGSVIKTWAGIGTYLRSGDVYDNSTILTANYPIWIPYLDSEVIDSAVYSFEIYNPYSGAGTDFTVDYNLNAKVLR